MIVVSGNARAWERKSKRLESSAWPLSGGLWVGLRVLAVSLGGGLVMLGSSARGFGLVKVKIGQKLCLLEFTADQQTNRRVLRRRADEQTTRCPSKPPGWASVPCSPLWPRGKEGKMAVAVVGLYIRIPLTIYPYASALEQHGQQYQQQQ